MTIRREVRVHCDEIGCGHWIKVRDFEDEAEARRRAAAEFGWRKIGKRDYCSQHVPAGAKLRQEPTT